MSEKKIPLWIDTDTGVDDAVMLMCAVKLEQLDIKGVSAVSGNVCEEKHLEMLELYYHFVVEKISKYILVQLNH